MATTPQTPITSVTHHLMEQGWYWGDADRATVSQALSDQPDGSFVVRNASTPGDFTLCVKYNSQVKLLRIAVKEGKCGFNTDSLTHDSVVRLIEFHRSISLNIFNDKLDVRLLYPVSVRRNSQNGKPLLKRGHLQQRLILTARNDAEWRERLEMEHLRTVHLAFERGAKLYDTAHQEQEKAETLHHALNQSIRDNELKLDKLQRLVETQTVVVEESAKSRSHSETLKDVFVDNKKFVEESMRRIKAELKYSVDKRNALSLISNEISLKRVNMKHRLSKLMELRSAVYDQIEPALATKMAAVLDSGAELIGGETTKVTQLLIDIELKWTPAQFLMCCSNKENAANALIHARYRIAQLDKAVGVERPPMDGIFLIRPSSSYADKLVLSVLHGERVSHCLIEQNEEGWGFEQSNVYLTTIADFVRYYSKVSLETHADAIKTTLRMPAFDPPSGDTSIPLKNGPGQIWTKLPISLEYMKQALLTDDPTKPPESPEPMPDSWNTESPDSSRSTESRLIRPTSFPETIPEQAE